MNSFEADLRLRLDGIRADELWRELRRVDSPQGPRICIGDRELINFSSNDYLGLANHPALKEASIRAIEKFGAGAGASRLICGSLAPFHELEEALASFKGTAAALTFSTGYAAALGTVTSLMSRDDIIILDKRLHASFVDAVRLSTPNVRVFPHNDLDILERHLKWVDVQVVQADARNAKRPRTLVITESIFSMDGDAAPLREIVALKEKYGAWLMVDEAHATGLYGAKRRGLAEAIGVSEHIEVQMGTLGKALGGSGGYICGSRALIDLLINRARSFIFSTAPVPAAAAAARTGIQIVESREGEQRKKNAWSMANLLQHSAVAAGIGIAAPDSLIVPFIVGEEKKAVSIADGLREQGVFVPSIRYPTVARGSARLRITLTAAHDAEDVAALVGALSPLVNRQS